MKFSATVALAVFALPYLVVGLPSSSKRDVVVSLAKRGLTTTGPEASMRRRHLATNPDRPTDAASHVSSGHASKPKDEPKHKIDPAEEDGSNHLASRNIIGSARSATNTNAGPAVIANAKKVDSPPPPPPSDGPEVIANTKSVNPPPSQLGPEVDANAKKEALPSPLPNDGPAVVASATGGKGNGRQGIGKQGKGKGKAKKMRSRQVKYEADLYSDPEGEDKKPELPPSHASLKRRDYAYEANLYQNDKGDKGDAGNVKPSDALLKRRGSDYEAEMNTNKEDVEKATKKVKPTVPPSHVSSRREYEAELYSNKEDAANATKKVKPTVPPSHVSSRREYEAELYSNKEDAANATKKVKPTVPPSHVSSRREYEAELYSNKEDAANAAKKVKPTVPPSHVSSRRGHDYKADLYNGKEDAGDVKPIVPPSHALLKQRGGAASILRAQNTSLGGAAGAAVRTYFLDFIPRCVLSPVRLTIGLDGGSSANAKPNLNMVEDEAMDGEGGESDGTSPRHRRERDGKDGKSSPVPYLSWLIRCRLGKRKQEEDFI
ncbi:hypothetical protein C0991_010327 [Blastosporella zonata]|nr:hypothetical protein C0991_010327 [Blastosporella zonata]